MKSGIRAFSLTELLIVLVVIALLFAAMAPIVTKRHIAETHETESIWNFVTGD
ncbi:prepilin-type N-terminal cleavage/methylation domain-containing protein, partial [bacterium]|nr:prepilin-type N-terminal cleavage/methylation domain-containing protein [bacterium]